MIKVFSTDYASAYDVIYSDKDYTGECDLIENIFHNYSKGSVRSVLDLGCGTGNHAIPLAHRGYKVVGVDRSAHMLAHARTKAASLPGAGNITFERGDIRSVDLKGRFDAVIMMFAVLSYQLENDDVLSALKTARRYLNPEGLLIFDVWYGPAVLTQRPSQRIKVIPTSEGQILRVASGELDVNHHVCTVKFQIWKLYKGQPAEETEEIHVMRYFFPLELKLFLESSGFAPLRLGAFPNFEQESGENTWNVLQVARAV
jgi:SAM-dependent methyltransferase